MRQVDSVIMVGALLVGGCSGMSTTQQRTLSGGAIGGGAGLLGGYAYDQYEKSQGRP
jgi:uncharacterized membrane protein YebE (DUF533 family)